MLDLYDCNMLISTQVQESNVLATLRWNINIFKTTLSSGGFVLTNLYSILLPVANMMNKLCSRSSTISFEGLKAMSLSFKMDNIKKNCKDLIIRRDINAENC